MCAFFTQPLIGSIDRLVGGYFFDKSRHYCVRLGSKNLDVAQDKGLTGECDFLLGQRTARMIVRSCPLKLSSAHTLQNRHSLINGSMSLL